ncbi:MAG: hypothetical protein P1P63_05255 [Treponemataceae bacterium]
MEPNIAVRENCFAVKTPPAAHVSVTAFFGKVAGVSLRLLPQEK